MDKSKLVLAISILLGCIILGGFFYASQVNKQQSIERQQQIGLEAERQKAEAKAEQERKEYVAKRKGECYEIYEKERDKWNNVKSNFYNEKRDVCEITYKQNKYNEAICEEKLKEYKDTNLDMRAFITECNEYFTNEF